MFSEICSLLQVFGELAEGFETLTRINEAYVDEKGRPYKNIRFIVILLYCKMWIKNDVFECLFEINKMYSF